MNAASRGPDLEKTIAIRDLNPRRINTFLSPLLLKIINSIVHIPSVKVTRLVFDTDDSREVLSSMTLVPLASTPKKC